MYGAARKLADIDQSLNLQTEQGKVMEFPTNVEGINGLVKDICEALINHLVCTLNCSFSTISDLHARLHCNKISMMKAFGPL